MTGPEPFARAYLAAPVTAESRAAHALLTRETLDLARGLPCRVIPYLGDDLDPDLDRITAEIRAGGLRVYARHGAPWHTVRETLAVRAVHDWLGHVAGRAGFDWRGEARAFRSQATHHSPLATLALRAEVLGQAAVYLTTGQFPEQRPVLLGPDTGGRIPREPKPTARPVPGTLRHPVPRLRRDHRT